MTSVPRAHWLWTPVLVYMALIFGLSSLSHTPDLPGGSDKVLHGLLYAGLGGLLTRALAGGLRRPITVVVVTGAIFIAAAYGVSDEFHQWFVPPRQVEALDVLADTIGAACAAGVVYVWSRLQRAPHRQGPV